MNKARAIEVIALDLDGTLLDRNTSVPPRNRRAIERAQACGVGIILATGKTREAAVPVMEQLAVTLPGVFFQGHLICDRDGRVLREKSMAPDDVAAVYAAVQERGLQAVIYDRDGLWATSTGYFRDVVHDKYHEPLPRLDFALQKANGINKFLIYVDGDREGLFAELDGRFGRRLRVFRGVSEYIEIMSPTVSKGEGVAWLLDYLGLDPLALLAVGDGENDIEMLRLASIGAAVGNAPLVVKEAADVVVASNEDGGVAEAIERFVLPACEGAAGSASKKPG